MNKKQKRSWIQNGIFAVIAITLYATGLHTEVIGFVQRGLLATGLMNPNVEVIAQVNYNTTEGENNTTDPSDPFTKADFNLTLIDAKGNEVSLGDFKGKVIFMNLWATWCPPCIAEMPSIKELQDYVGDDAAFVMLSLDKDFEKAKAFNTRKGYNFPIYTLATNLPKMYQSSSIPTTFIIDAKGNLRMIHKGMADYSTMDFKNFLNSLK
ncbi:TlpA family protein disulfide reductase [Ulvibacter litoralis]|uniref:Thiol-disulfide isomerase or thioredoxin n=1 Tax=Ulvibacter litoralis TaxID=227084 RepID=A0A1G7CBY2_9FLAO|nr:TlpA disulfide reductase family protein [Ulvibacter litoralis]GHC48156.1 hypothetical protein GCM10008083_09330 [Ulvibacter litoralis]SDE35895.1 Thiol-disulfide isomerase or thioredoxin [Ulvibacter litoralis]